SPQKGKVNPARPTGEQFGYAGADLADRTQHPATKWTSETVKAMSVSRVKHVNASAWAACPADAYAGLTAEAFAAIPPAAMRSMTVDQLLKVPADALIKTTADQVKELP